MFFLNSLLKFYILGPALSLWNLCSFELYTVINYGNKQGNKKLPQKQTTKTWKRSVRANILNWALCCAAVNWKDLKEWVYNDQILLCFYFIIKDSRFSRMHHNHHSGFFFFFLNYTGLSNSLVILDTGL